MCVLYTMRVADGDGADAAAAESGFSRRFVLTTNDLRVFPGAGR